MVSVGDQRAFLQFQRLEQGGLAELGTVDEDEGLVAVVVNDALLRSLANIEGAEARFRTATTRPDEGLVKEDVVQQPLRQGAGDRSDAGQVFPGQHGDPHPFVGEQVEQVGIGGDHLDPASPQEGHHLQRGGPGVEVDGVAIAHFPGCGRRNGDLGVLVDQRLRLGRELRQALVEPDGTTPQGDHLTGLDQHIDVATDGGRRNSDGIDEVVDIHHVSTEKRLQNHALPFVLNHF
ncbi:MAG: hypothetical protein WBC14_10895 [Propionicimonas sp.]